MTYLIHTIFLGILLFVLGRRGRREHSLWVFYLAVVVKFVSGWLMGYLYLSYYNGGDTIVYFQRAVEFNQQNGQTLAHYLNGLLFSDIEGMETQSRSVFFIKMISPVVFFSGADYWLSSLYLSLFSFAGLWRIVRVLSDRHGIGWNVYLSFLFFPSVVFWTSGISKDAVAAGAMSYAISYVLQFRWQSRIGWAEWLVVLLMACLLAGFKFYASMLLIAFVLLVVGGKWVSNARPVYKLLFLGGFMAAVVMSMQWFHPWLTTDRLPLTVYEVHEAVRRNTQPEERSPVQLEPTYRSMIRSVPMALFSGLFFPLPWHHPQWISLGVRLENFSLLVLTVLSLFYLRKTQADDLLFTTLALIAVAAVFIAFTTPNMGSLSRYKSLYIPYYMFLVSFFPFRLVFPPKQSR
ncbi:MAG: hypothetical protein OEY56_03200 [Cyclobacteriaceae bacterium]|nr:hypothetical protein [Cyclobacteriaceae bacterium]